MSLDCSPLANAIALLERSREYANSDMARADEGLFEQMRFSAIHCFNLAYDQSHKMLKRYLEATSTVPSQIDLTTFQTLIRTGSEQGLLRSDWSRWRDYRQARTDSSHAYDLHMAMAVYEIAPDFLLEAHHLYRQLLARSGQMS